MKKLMVAFVAAAVAVCTQASTVNWTAANVYDGANKIAKGSTDYVGLLCLYTDGSGVSSSALATYLGSSDYTTAEKIAKINSAAVAGSDAGVATTTDGLFQLAVADAATMDAGTYKAYAILFDVADIGDITDSTRYIITAEAASAQTVPTSGNKTIALGNMQAATQNVTWGTMNNVPEPTSGLLILLGMAGLALRRRRA